MCYSEQKNAPKYHPRPSMKSLSAYGYTYGRDNPLQKINFTFQKLVPRTSSFGGNLVVERVARTS